MKNILRLLGVLAVVLTSCKGPMVTDTLDSNQITEMIAEKPDYENIIRDLNEIRYAFEADPILTAKFSNYSYKDYLTFLDLLKDSSIAIQAFEKGILVAQDSLNATRLKLKSDLKDTIAALQSVDASVIANVTFDSYQFTQTNEKYSFQRNMKSKFKFKIESKVPMKAVRIEYSVLKQREDGTYYDFNHYDDHYVAESGLEFYYSRNAKKVAKEQKELGKEIIISSVLEYDGETLERLSDRLRVSRDYYEMSDNNKTLFAKLQGVEISNSKISSGEYKVEIKDILIISSDDREYLWPVQYQLGNLEYKDSYTTDEEFSLLRYFFNSPSTFAPVFQKSGYGACYSEYYGFIDKDKFQTPLQDYISDTYGLDEYVKTFEKLDPLGIELKSTISKFRDKSKLERFLDS